jgi:hypothetical protein
MVIGVLVAALIVVPLDYNDRWFLVAAGVLAAFGAADDRFDLDYRLKLLGQLIAILIVVIGGDTQIHSITLDERVMLPQWLSIPLTVFFLVGITNAINLADGLDGLAGGTTFLVPGCARHAFAQQRTARDRRSVAGLRRRYLGVSAVQYFPGQRLHGGRRQSTVGLRRRRAESPRNSEWNQRVERGDAGSASCVAHTRYPERYGAADQ